LKNDEYIKLIKGVRKFVKNHNVPIHGFITAFMDTNVENLDPISIHGPAIIKKSNLNVMIAALRRNKLHGHCLIYMLGKLIALQHYEEGEKVDLPIECKEKELLPNDEVD